MRNPVTIAVTLDVQLAALLDQETFRRQAISGPRRRLSRAATLRELLTECLTPMPAPAPVQPAVRTRTRSRKPLRQGVTHAQG